MIPTGTRDSLRFRALLSLVVLLAFLPSRPAAAQAESATPLPFAPHIQQAATYTDQTRGGAARSFYFPAAVWKKSAVPST